MAFFYLSQILRRPVLLARGGRVARVKDIVARLEALNATGVPTREEYPPISGLVVEIEKRDVFVPWARIRSLGPEGACLAANDINLGSFQRRDGEVLLARDILDKQLIDIDGRRVIRANDLQLFGTDVSVRVTAVDVSGEALLRRLTNGRFFHAGDGETLEPMTTEPRTRLRPRQLGPRGLIKWADIEPLKAGVPDVRLSLPHDRLALLHPVDLAHIADELGYREGAEIIESLDPETAAEILQEMDEERQADIVEGMDHERAADILEEMDPDDAADLLGDLDEDHAEALLRRMEPEDAEDVQALLTYPEDTAGGMMTTEFITIPERLTVDDAILFMRQIEDPPDVIDYLYVVEEDEPGTDWAQVVRHGGGKLTGIVSLRDLLLSQAEIHIRDLMETDFVWVTLDEDEDAASRLMAEYNLLALPVLDEHGNIRGIITVDDAMERLLPEPWLKRLPQVFG